MSDRVNRWLEEIGLGAHAESFVENDIDFDLLTRLSTEELKELGLSVGHRRRFLDAVAKLKEAAFEGAGSSSPSAPRGEAERRQLTVMFCDLVGSTELSQKLDAEDLREVNRAYQDACKAAIERYEGYIARYMGDGVLAYFGYPQAHEDDAARAIHAGLDVVEAVGDLAETAVDLPGFEPRVRVGIASGPVVVGDLIGEGASQESAVVGETPNLAARLQGLATPNTVAISPVTHELAGERFEYQDLGAHELKGMDKAVRAWRVIAPTVAESRFEAIHRAALTPLVGREHELGLLFERWEQAKDGEGQVVLLSGEAGIGKSRITEALRECMVAEDAIQFRYQCSAYHTNSTLYPVIAQLERAARFEKGDSSETKFEKIESLFSNVIASPQVAASLLAPVLSIPTAGRYAPLELTPDQQKQAMLETLFSQIESCSQRRTVLVLFEDAHWVDPTSLEYLELMVGRAQTAHLLVVITFRPEFTHSWSIHTHITSLMLNRFGRNLVAEMLNNVTAGKPLPDEIHDQIMLKTDGIPLFVEELTKSVLESGLLEEQANRYTLRGSFAQVAIPATLQDSLMARLDRLTKGKQVAQTGAAIGREFTLELLEPASELDRPELDEALTELVNSALVFRRGSEDSSTYVFKNALVQDAAYDSLLLSKRKPLHRRIAEALEGNAPDQPVMIAHHWERAEQPDKAIHFRLAAAEQAAKVSALWEAIAQYWCILNILERLSETRETRETRETQVRRVQTLLALLDIRLHGTGFWRDHEEKERIHRHIHRAIDSSTEFGDHVALARLKSFEGYVWSDELLLTQAVKHATASEDRRVQAEVADQVASYLSNLGRFEDSLTHARRGVQLYSEIGAEVEQGLVCAMSARCHSARAGRLGESLEFARKAREIADRTRDLRLTSRMAMEAEPYLYLGRWGEVTRVVENGLPVAWEAGNWFVILFSSAWAAIAYIKLGRLDDASRLLDKALETADPRVGSEYPRIYFQVALSQLKLAKGETEAALNAARQAIAFAGVSTHTLDEGAAHRVLGEVYKTKGNRREADVAFRRSLKVLGEIQSRPELAQSLLVYGRFKRDEDANDGKQLIERALEMFEEINATGWVEEARVALTG
ncbi:MAG: AAA family ATPase [Gemmatimonadetes bacterium]|nr:AAA family ATPase [Gemmatimonadota bacterium]